jgi:hypothetical protein
MSWSEDLGDPPSQVICFTRLAPAADPVHVPEPGAQRSSPVPM